VGKFSDFHFAFVFKAAQNKTACVYHLIVHEDADARQSRRIGMRLKSSGAISMLIWGSQHLIELSMQMT
jgi:hypothetical protein